MAIRICEHCGAPLQVTGKVVKCEYCGCETVFEGFTGASVAHDPANTGARQSAPQADAVYQAPPLSSEEKPKKKGHLILWILGWLFIFPLPATILIQRKKNEWSPIIRYALIIFLWMLYLGAGSSGGNY
jgi:hypothetical protein